MEGIYLKEVIEAVGGKCNDKYNNVLIHSVSTDSRKIKIGDLYIALKGDIYDGHDFVEDAAQNGALAVIVSKSVKINQEVQIVQVDDTLKALWQIASYYRRKLSKPVIAVTGSVGKTSTKDTIAAILSAKYNVHKSQGNFNNHIGLPLTILGLQNNHDAMVVEMGMRGFGEIRELTYIAQPSIAIITNIGISHIERLGTQENILKAKLEIVEGLNENGVLIINANDSLLCNIDKNIAKKIVYVGVETKADYNAYSIVDYGEEGVSFKIKLKGKEYDVRIPAVGVHNVYNVLFGIACGVELGLNTEEILNGINNYHPGEMRLNIIEKNGIKFINDCYNACPDSMKAGLQVLSSLAKDSRSFAVIGNMFELGDMASTAHYNVGKMCRELGIDFVAIMGENANDVAKGIGDIDKYKIFKTHEEIIEYLKGTLRKGDIVLVKGSRGMKMERILDLWQAGMEPAQKYLK